MQSGQPDQSQHCKMFCNGQLVRLQAAAVHSSSVAACWLLHPVPRQLTGKGAALSKQHARRLAPGSVSLLVIILIVVLLVGLLLHALGNVHLQRLDITSSEPNSIHSLSVLARNVPGYARCAASVTHCPLVQHALIQTAACSLHGTWLLTKLIYSLAALLTS